MPGRLGLRSMWMVFAMWRHIRSLQSCIRKSVCLSDFWQWQSILQTNSLLLSVLQTDKHSLQSQPFMYNFGNVFPLVICLLCTALPNGSDCAVSKPGPRGLSPPGRELSGSTGAVVSCCVSVPGIVKWRDLGLAFLCSSISQPFETFITWRRSADSSTCVRKRAGYARDCAVFISVP